METDASYIVAPAGFTLHTESSSSILLPQADPTTGQKEVFLNPAQEYNRDLSIVAIRTWSEIFADEEAERRERSRARRAANGGPKKRQKLSHEGAAAAATTTSEAVGVEILTVGKADETMAEAETAPTTSEKLALKPAERRTFTCFEALAASGLRSIRYAKEIPLLRWVIANDLSESAVKSIHEHVKLNDLKPPEGKDGKVRPLQGDCLDGMYAHRSEKKRFDVVDLDPYGTAAPFLDAAVQSVSDGGLLCVTCTDVAVLAGSHYPEKAFSNYGGTSMKAEFSHEALRLVLNAISSCAIRYGRCIVPMLSLSIDFYVRVFVRIRSSPLGAKRASANTAVVYCCHGCSSTHVQALARAVGTTGNETFKNASGPPMATNKCDECGSGFAVGGPMWAGSLHDRTFVKRMLEHVNEATPAPTYGTLPRLKGMLAVAHSELDVPFYFTSSTVAGHFHCTAPSLNAFASALLHAGYDVSRSHAAAGSIKTTAPRTVIHDIMRAWIKDHPVTLNNIKDGSPARPLLAKESTLTEVKFAIHPALDEKMLTTVKLIRYQDTPAGHGPAAIAKGGKGKRRRN